MKSKSKRKRNKKWGTWKCTKCSEVFSTCTLLKKHRKIHIKPKFDDIQYSYNFDASRNIYNCVTCDYECDTIEEIKKHAITHNEHFTCKTCTKKFDEPYKYATHVNTHTGDENFKCPLCLTYETPRRVYLHSHIKTLHLRLYHYRCDICGKGFNDNVQFKEHKNIHEGLRPFKCVVCGKDFPFSIYLTTHQQRCHKVTIDGVIGTTQCSICLRRYANVRTYEKHIKKHESDDKKKKKPEKRHLCDICGKGYAVKDKLVIHYRTHTGDKPYSCSYCPKRFIKRDYLIMHERVHSGEKPYSCEFCGKCFNQGAPLRVHIRMHTGEKPYICHLCNSGYTSRSSLSLHLRNCNGA